MKNKKRITHYFITCICEDYLPKCNFKSPEEPVIYDSTAGAIAACKLLVITNHVPEHGKHIPIIYGDYYFVEAIYKLKGNKTLFW